MRKVQYLRLLPPMCPFLSQSKRLSLSEKDFPFLPACQKDVINYSTPANIVFGKISLRNNLFDGSSAKSNFLRRWHAPPHIPSSELHRRTQDGLLINKLEETHSVFLSSVCIPPIRLKSLNPLGAMQPITRLASSASLV